MSIEDVVILPLLEVSGSFTLRLLYIKGKRLSYRLERKLVSNLRAGLNAKAKRGIGVLIEK
jgi:hypothetical protein